MGYINIQIGGSFLHQFGIKSTTEQFSAMQHGHADAVGRAITYLADVVLPRATALDHHLQERGERPDGGFTPDRITEGVDMSLSDDDYHGDGRYPVLGR